MFVEMFEMEIVQQMRRSGARLTSTGESNRSMCDDACCDFSGQEIQKYISHIDWRIESVDVR